MIKKEGALKLKVFEVIRMNIIFILHIYLLTFIFKDLQM